MSHIVNQDRDQIFEYFGQENDLYTVPVMSCGTLMGFDLMLKDKLLGTFDSLETSILEMQRIIASREEIEIVDGYFLAN